MRTVPSASRLRGAASLRAPALALAALVTLAACGGEDPLPPLTFSWVALPGAVCSDGSPTGIGVEPGPGPNPDVLVFLNGGGACWDALTCFTLRTATPGPFGASQLQAGVATLRAGSLFDRTAPGNPYADFTFVFVPYCTGDVHAGNTVRTYPGTYPGAPRAWHHKGAANLTAAFDWLATGIPDPARVVVAGASAGGFGSLHAFDLAKRTWSSAKGYLVDDSGPPLAEIPQTTIDLWYREWSMGDVVTPLCGAACQQDLSLTLDALSARYPDDRLALLSSTQDETIRFFFGTSTPAGIAPMEAAVFEDGVRALAGKMETLGNAHAFLVPGSGHTMLGSPGEFASGGVGLFEWLRRQVEDDPAWGQALPPDAAGVAPVAASR